MGAAKTATKRRKTVAPAATERDPDSLPYDQLTRGEKIRRTRRLNREQREGVNRALSPAQAESVRRSVAAIDDLANRRVSMTLSQWQGVLDGLSGLGNFGGDLKSAVLVIDVVGIPMTATYDGTDWSLSLEAQA